MRTIKPVPRHGRAALLASAGHSLSGKKSRFFPPGSHKVRWLSCARVLSVRAGMRSYSKTNGAGSRLQGRTVLTRRATEEPNTSRALNLQNEPNYAQLEITQKLASLRGQYESCAAHHAKRSQYSLPLRSAEGPPRFACCPTTPNEPNSRCAPEFCKTDPIVRNSKEFKSLRACTISTIRVLHTIPNEPRIRSAASRPAPAK